MTYTNQKDFRKTVTTKRGASWEVTFYYRNFSEGAWHSCETKGMLSKRSADLLVEEYLHNA